MNIYILSGYRLRNYTQVTSTEFVQDIHIREVSSLLDFNILSTVQDHLSIIKLCHLRKFKNVSLL